MYTVETFPLGIFQANCYLLWKDKHVIMVDPGAKSQDLLQYLLDKEAIVDGILLTHGHFDHIGGVDFFVSHFSCPVYIDEADVVMLKDTYLNGSIKGREGIVNSEVQLYKVGKNSVGEFTFDAIFAPGHSHGCVMLRFDNILFSGDVLFQGTIGRTDLPVSDPKAMNESLKMIKKLNPALLVYPGHGASTTLKEELTYNPFLI